MEPIKRTFILFLLSMIYLGPSTLGQAETLTYSAGYQLLVNDVESTKTLIANAVTRKGGYITEDTKERLTLAIPSTEVDEFMHQLAAFGTVADRSLQSRQLDQILIEKRAQLKSRETMLKRYMTVLDQSASRDDFADVQGQLHRLVTEIEADQSEIRKLSRQSAFADITINFKQSVQKAIVAERDDSPFPWINTVKISRLLGDF